MKTVPKGTNIHSIFQNFYNIWESQYISSKKEKKTLGVSRKQLQL